MCYPSPGPRCANHLAKAMDKNAAAIQEAQAKGDRKGLAALKEEQSQQWHEFSGTKSGQKVLQEKIDNETDPSVRDYLEKYKIDCREKYTAKYRAMKEQSSEAFKAKTAKQSVPASPASSSSYSGKGRRTTSGKYGTYTAPTPTTPAPTPTTPAPTPNGLSASSYWRKPGGGGKY